MGLHAPDVNGPIQAILKCGSIMSMVPMCGLILFHMYRYNVSTYQYVP